MTPEQEAEVRQLVREELSRLLGPARENAGLRERLERRMREDQGILRRLHRTADGTERFF